MKTKNIIGASLALAALTVLNLQSPTAFAQGSLTPPGAPGPMMKSLDQIEARTAISSAPYSITNPGSYYLTTNLTIADNRTMIWIQTNGVTLDFNGFSLLSTDPTAMATGITINGSKRNITILNGSIQGGVTNDGSGTYSGSGFRYGITIAGSPASTRVSGVSVSGCSLYGIYLGVGEGTIVESCAVRTVGSYGIYAYTVKDSSAMDCGSTAIYGRHVSGSCGQSIGTGIYAAIADDCYGVSLGSGYGISAKTAQNCYGGSTNNIGLSAVTAINCWGASTNTHAVYATSAHNCYGFSESGTGVYVTTAENCYGATASGDGVNAATALNCYGTSDSGFGLYALVAQGCYGKSKSDDGLYAARTAIGCSGMSTSGTGLRAANASFCTGFRNSGTAIQATIANGCYASSGTNDITYKYNMP